MQLVLSWPVRVIVIGLLIFSLFVDGAGYWYRIANHYSLTGYAPNMPPSFNGWQLYIHRGLDIQGGSHIEERLTDIPPGRNPADVQAEAIAVINKRINSLGVNEPYVVPEGNDRIIIELAGVPVDKAQAVIGSQAKLVTTTWVADPKATAGLNTQAGYRPQITNLTSDMVQSANAALDSQGLSWTVNISFNSQGSDIFSKLTSDAYNSCPTTGCATRYIAEWLDLTQDDINQWGDPAFVQKVTQPPPRGKLLTNPIIQAPAIAQPQISGSFTQASATNLATELNSGALPANIVVLASTDVGSTLGADSVRKSLIAGALGLAVVILFMVAYYRLPGLLASVALLFYAGAILAVYKVVPVTVTLAGMAGFILSVGMAVDANVLIFERFKEEMRAGRTIGAAVDAAVRRAWPAIRDSNTSTLITSAILYGLGSGSVQGFALTLMIGVFISLISSIIVTHNLLAIVLAFSSFRNASILGVQRGRAA